MFNYKFLTTAFALTVIVITLMSANMTKAQVIQDGLVSYWPFDEADISGDTVKDVFGKNDGTITGDPKIVKGHLGEALEFDGDDHIICGDDPSILLVDTDFSITVWFNADGVTENRYLVGTYGKNGKWYLLNVQGGELSFGVDDDVKKTQIQSPINEGQWYYAVAVREKGNEIRLYVDGALEVSAADQTGVIDSDSPVYIGDRLAGARAFIGRIDDMAIYNRALSENEIKQNFAAEGLAVVNFANKLAGTRGEMKASR